MIPACGNNAPTNSANGWRHLAFLGFSNYAVSDQPWIVNLTTGYLMDGYLDSAGYVAICMIHDDGRKINHKMHRIVAKAFHGVPIDKNLTPDHINRIRNDNRPENLRWATREEQRANQERPLFTKGRMVTQMFANGFEIVTWFSIDEATRQTGISPWRIRNSAETNKETDGYRWKFEIGYLEGELWFPVNMANFETCYVSNKGRFCTSKFLVTYGSTTDSGYRRVTVATLKGRSKQIMLHRLVALVFIGPDDRLVNHKNGNKRDNRPENLEYMTVAENNDHAAKTGLTRHKLNGKQSKPVKQMDLQLRTLAIYLSLSDAQRQTGISGSDIGWLCKHKNTTTKCGGNFLWAYATPEDRVDPTLNQSTMKVEGFRSTCKVVDQYTHGGVFVARHDSAAAAFRATGAPKSSISQACTIKGRQAGGFLWKRP